MKILEEDILKIDEKQPIKPEWSYCPKCNGTNIKVEKCVFYTKTFNKGNIRSISVEPASKIGPTVTTCIECGYEDEEDVE